MRPSRASSKTRIVGYGYAVPDGHGYCVPSVFDESKMERVLEDAKAAGVITQYDTGRGAVVWFNGPPGRRMRELRDKVRAMLPANAVPLSRLP